MLGVISVFVPAQVTVIWSRRDILNVVPFCVRKGRGRSVAWADPRAHIALSAQSTATAHGSAESHGEDALGAARLLRLLLLGNAHAQK